MNLSMDLAALCDMWRWKWQHNGSHLAVFSEDVAFSHHFVAPYLLPPYKSASGIGYASKNYLKWQEIQLAIHCTADTVNYLE